jgi:hypothetical protein
MSYYLISTFIGWMLFDVTCYNFSYISAIVSNHTGIMMIPPKLCNYLVCFLKKGTKHSQLYIRIPCGNMYMSFGRCIVCILEYCEEGNLRDWLLRNNDRVGDEVVEKLFQIILGVSNGMKYLSSKKVLMLYHLMNVAKLCIKLFSILNNKCLPCYVIIEYQSSLLLVSSFVVGPNPAIFCSNMNGNKIFLAASLRWTIWKYNPQRREIVDIQITLNVSSK